MRFPLSYKQLNHITTSMQHLTLETLRLNLSVLLRTFLLNIHPSEYGCPEMNLSASQPVSLLCSLVKSIWARTTLISWAQEYHGIQPSFFNFCDKTSKVSWCRIPKYKSGLAWILSVTAPKQISWAWKSTEAARPWVQDCRALRLKGEDSEYKWSPLG